MKPGAETIAEGASDEEEAAANDTRVGGGGGDPPGSSARYSAMDDVMSSTAGTPMSTGGGGAGAFALGSVVQLGSIGGNLRGHLGYSMPAVAVHKVRRLSRRVMLFPLRSGA